MSNEGRIFALHAWWQYHVDRAELDAIWAARWEAYIAAGGSGPRLSDVARRLRWQVEAEMPAGTLLREGERGDCAAFLTVEDCWDASTHAPTDLLLTGARAQSATIPAPRPADPPEIAPEAPEPPPEASHPKKRAKRAKAAQSAPKESAPTQSSFDDLRKEFGL